MTPAEAFARTPDEQARLDSAPFLGADAAGWLEFAAKMCEQILGGYADGEMTVKETLRLAYACSVGCDPKGRALLLAWTAREVLGTTPKTRCASTASKKRPRKPPYPTWLKRSAATLLDMFHEDAPRACIAPNEMNGWTTAPLKKAIAGLVALELCPAESPIQPRTLYSWWLQYGSRGAAAE